MSVVFKADFNFISKQNSSGDMNCFIGSYGFAYLSVCSYKIGVC